MLRTNHDQHRRHRAAQGARRRTRGPSGAGARATRRPSRRRSWSRKACAAREICDPARSRSRSSGPAVPLSRIQSDIYADLGLAEPVDAGDVARGLRAALDKAEAFVRAMLAGKEGLLFLKDGRVV